LQTALSAAAREGHEETARLLLASGAQVNARCFDGSTPLHAAVLGQHASMVELLRQAGADPALKDEDGHTPLRFARNMLEMYVDKPNPALKKLGFRVSAEQAAECRRLVQLLERK
jgi:ankyrin repeat protein